MSAKRPRLKKVERETPSIVPEQVEKLKELFPEAVSEGKVDFDRLRQTLGEFADDRPERYSFTWAGKRDCIKLLQVPSRATLVPSPDESIDWDTTNNVFIEGENLEVLKLLYKAYYGRVKMVYIDPPYNTGKDFIYPDNYADPLDTYLRLTGQKDSEGNVLTSNPETSGRYHSSWLSMMYPRLFVARQLLRDDGVIFVSIDDNEVYNLRAAMNEVFGEENFLACFVVQSNPRGSQSVEHAAVVHEYVLFYARQTQQLQSTGLTLNDAMRAEYKYTLPDGRHYRFLGLRQRGGAWRREQRPLLYYPIFVDPATGRVSLDRSAKHSIEVWPVKPTTGEKGTWRWNKRKVASDSAWLVAKTVRRGTDGGSAWDVFQLDLLELLQGDERKTKAKTIWAEAELNYQNATTEVKGLFGGSEVFAFPKPKQLVKRLTRLAGCHDDDIMLDFFAGSCTGAQSLLEANQEDGDNRRFIMVQLQEPTGRKDYPTIADIGKDRIRRVIAKMKKEQTGKLATEGPQDLGFRVYKLAESNMKLWKGTEEKDPEKYAKTMEMFLDPLVEGWKPEDVIAEVALKEAGFGLNCRVEELNPQITQITQKDGQGQARKRTADSNHGPHVFKVTDADKEQSFYISLDDKVRLEDMKFLNLTRDILFVCRDVALDDETAANLALQCRLRTI